MAFKDTDKILVHRDGVDYQADLGPLMGGGAGLDDILNAPVVKDVVYSLWEDNGGNYVSMELKDGDGSNGSTWLSATEPYVDSFGNDGQNSLEGYIEYATSADIDRLRGANSMAVINDLVITAYSPDLSEDWTASGKLETFSHQGYFNVFAGQKSEGWSGNPKSVVYKLKLEFTNVYGEPETLWVDGTAYNYVAMRREDIDLREMEKLDAALKLKKSQTIAKLKSNKTL